MIIYYSIIYYYNSKIYTYLHQNSVLLNYSDIQENRPHCIHYTTTLNNVFTDQEDLIKDKELLFFLIPISGT